jgi:DNA repair protein RadA/Sms
VGKARAHYRCSECLHTAAKWVGRCPDCGGWGTVEELGAGGRGGLVAIGGITPPAVAAVSITTIDPDLTRHVPTGVSELDRVLGGGVVPGSVTLLAGEPGVGKSTLLLEVAHRWALARRRALYISAEESAGQVRMRAERTDCTHSEVFLAAESDVYAVLGHIDAVKPSLVIVDSVQTMSANDFDGVIGGVTQVKAITAILTAAAKSTDVAMVLVGHVTKDGAIAGPRSLEHLVDVVLHFEGDPNSTLRTVRGVKNRFGASDEVGCFVMQDGGITGLADPSGLFLDQRPAPVPGTAITVTLDGKRPMLGEVQALLIAPNGQGAPRRTVSGIDATRVSMIAAVLEKRGRLGVGFLDIYLSTVGGMRLNDPSADLAVAMAMASARIDRPLPKSVVVIGEVGLAGDIRRVTGLDRRLAEAARLGFTKALVPVGAGSVPDGMQAIECPTMADALSAMVGISHPKADSPKHDLYAVDNKDL